MVGNQGGGEKGRKGVYQTFLEGEEEGGIDYLDKSASGGEEEIHSPLFERAYPFMSGGKGRGSLRGKRGLQYAGVRYDGGRGRKGKEQFQ